MADICLQTLMPSAPLRRLGAALFAAALFVGGAHATDNPPSTKEGSSSMTTDSRVKLQTNHGDIVIQLDAEKAPKTTANFIGYVRDGFYDGTVFHRVINNFMIQGGGFEAGMKQKKTKDPVENEANNGLKNDRYTIAMARTSDPHSATAQFFINVADNDFLNHTAPTTNGWGYAVFGKVVEGTEVVDKIKGVKTGNRGFHQDVPAEDVVIEKAVVVE
jgi:Peptidyl-prolyl cis-trans isomerase (rotamase) - cyclophilin family